MSFNVTLGCNTTSVQGSDPVAWGLISAAITALCVLYQYVFWGVSGKKAITHSMEVKNTYTSTGTFLFVEWFFLHALWEAVCIGFVSWALAEYVKQNYQYNGGGFGVGYNLLSPQDVANIFYFSIGLFMVVFYRLYQITRGAHHVNEETWTIEDTTKPRPDKKVIDETTKEAIQVGETGTSTDIGVSIFFPIGMLIAICLFAGSYGYLQVGSHSFCGKSQTWFGSGDYVGFTTSGKALAVVQLVNGLTLACHLVLRYWPSWRTWTRERVSYEDKVFFAGTNKHNDKRAILIGWLPLIDVDFWWCMAFSWFFAQSIIFTHYDLYKAIGVYFSTSFVSIVLSMLSGTFRAFPAYFFCSIFIFFGIQYIGTLVKPLNNNYPSFTPTQNQSQIDWGLFSTGPATDVDFWTVYVFVSFGMALTGLAFLIQFNQSMKKETST